MLALVFAIVFALVAFAAWCAVVFSALDEERECRSRRAATHLDLTITPVE